MAIYSTAACAQTPLLETGVWFDDSGNGAVEIYVCAEKADRLCGRIVWLKEPLNAQGVPKRDRFNPKESLQTRPICGLPILGNLARMQEGGFDEGWIYDPKAGKSYSAAIELSRKDKLTVTGYVGMKFLSKSFIWTRAPADLQRCEGAPGTQAAKPAPAKPVAAAAAAPQPKPTASAAAAAAAPKPPATALAPAAAPVTRVASPAGAAVAAPAPKPAVKPAAAAPAAKPAATAAKPTVAAAKPLAPASAAKPATATAAGAAKAAPTSTASALPDTATVAQPAQKPRQAESGSILHGPFSWSED